VTFAVGETYVESRMRSMDDVVGVLEGKGGGFLGTVVEGRAWRNVRRGTSDL
jgi:hypothetical protein